MPTTEVNYYIKTQEMRRSIPRQYPPLPKLYRSRKGGLQLYEPNIILNDSKLFVDPSARIDGFTKLECGEGLYIEKLVHIASFVHILGGGICILEEGSSLASGVKLITGSNIPGLNRGCSAIDPNAKIERSFIHIKKNATIFCNSVILPGITVGEGAVIGAGSVVTKDVPDGETWLGSPARKAKSKTSKTIDNDNNVGSISVGKPITSEDWVERFSEVYEIYDNENPLFI